MDEPKKKYYSKFNVEYDIFKVVPYIIIVCYILYTVLSLIVIYLVGEIFASSYYDMFDSLYTYSI